MAKDCVLFGLRSTEDIDSKRCIKCGDETPDIYDKCSIESVGYFNTSVKVNEEGKTVFVPFIPHIIKPKAIERLDIEKPKIQKTKNKNSKKLKGKKMVIPTDPEYVSTERKERKETKGVLQVAKQMVTDGRPNQEIFQTLIEIYLRDGKSPRQAKKNSHCAIFHARKKLGLKEAGSKITEDIKNPEPSLDPQGEDNVEI